MDKLLLVEDADGLREQMKWALQEDFEVIEAWDRPSALSALSTCGPGEIPLVLLDMGLENHPERGLLLIDDVMNGNRRAKLIVVTSNSDPSLGGRCLERGAFDYLEKPVDIEALKGVLARARRILELERRLEKPFLSAPASPHRADPLSRLAAFVGQSPDLLAALARLRKLAPTDIPVLLSGEPGTGKTLAAKALHEESGRKNRPFLTVNCAAFSESALEEEIFGREADEEKEGRRKGLLEAADGGTLVLDHFEAMPPRVATRIEAFMEGGRLLPVPEIRGRRLPVRILATTTAGLPDSSASPSPSPIASKQGDLFHRLARCEIRLPPLRERPDDILPLAEHFLAEARKKFSLPRLRLSPRAEEALLAEDWPGNIRELETRLEKAALFARSPILEREDLELDASPASLKYREAKKNFDRTLILQALRRARGRISLAARNLGLTRPTLYDLIRRTGLKKKELGITAGH